jgi:tetratricopeptide (TPR) repeat protein
VARILNGGPFRAIALVACVLLAACVQAPGQPIPVREAAAIDANRRAEAYFRRGDLASAALHYREALRMAQSIEDADAVAANALNLSIVYQRLGKPSDARASLAPVIENGRLAFSPLRLAQASLRRSVLEFDERRYAEAAEWIGKAASYCGSGNCPLAAAIHNMQGQLSLASGQIDAAAASARSALAASTAASDRIEAANALRLFGSSALRANDGSGALQAFSQAFAIDKELALPRKIYLDLIGLGQASALRGERDTARVFFERALAVSEADRDSSGTREALALLKELSERP